MLLLILFVSAAFAARAGDEFVFYMDVAGGSLSFYGRDHSFIDVTINTTVTYQGESPPPGLLPLGHNYHFVHEFYTKNSYSVGSYGLSTLVKQSKFVCISLHDSVYFVTQLVPPEFDYLVLDGFGSVLPRPYADIKPSFSCGSRSNKFVATVVNNTILGYDTVFYSSTRLSKVINLASEAGKTTTLVFKSISNDYICTRVLDTHIPYILRFKCQFSLPNFVTQSYGLVYFDQDDIKSHYIGVDFESFLYGSTRYCFFVRNVVEKCVNFTFVDFELPSFSYTPGRLDGVASILLPSTSVGDQFCAGVNPYTQDGVEYMATFREGDCGVGYQGLGAYTYNYVVGESYIKAAWGCINDPIYRSGFKYQVCYKDYAYAWGSDKKIRFTNCYKVDPYRHSCDVSSDFVGYRIVCDGYSCPPRLAKFIIGYQPLKLYLSTAESMSSWLYSDFRAGVYKTRGATQFLVDLGPGLAVILIILIIWILLVVILILALLYSFLELISIKYDKPYDRRIFAATLFSYMFMSFTYFTYKGYSTLFRVKSSSAIPRGRVAIGNLKRPWIILSFLAVFGFPIYFLICFILGFLITFRLLSKKFSYPVNAVKLDKLDHNRRAVKSKPSKKILPRPRLDEYVYMVSEKNK